MFLSLLLASLVAAVPSASAVRVSDGVRGVVAKHKGRLTAGTAGQELEVLAGQGDSTAAALLGELFLFADPADRDPLKGCAYSEKAGEHASALHNLATCYYDGSGRLKDRAKARALYARAAEMGFDKAHCAYGNMLISGDGGAPDIQRGLALCKEAADFGNADAQTDYAGYLLSGKHVPKAAAEARKYLEQAAGTGQRNAAFLLGQVYWNGDGIEKNVPQAAIWWITAYEKGRTDAALLIGNAAMSLVVEAAKTKQPVAIVVIDQAKKWLGIAAEQDPDPKKREKAKETLGLLQQLLAGR